MNRRTNSSCFTKQLYFVTRYEFLCGYQRFEPTFCLLLQYQPFTGRYLWIPVCVRPRILHLALTFSYWGNRVLSDHSHTNRPPGSWGCGVAEEVTANWSRWISARLLYTTCHVDSIRFIGTKHLLLKITQWLLTFIRIELKVDDSVWSTLGIWFTSQNIPPRPC